LKTEGEFFFGIDAISDGKAWKYDELSGGVFFGPLLLIDPAGRNEDLVGIRFRDDLISEGRG